MIQGLNHITLAVSDLDRSLRFYREVLGLTGRVMWEKGAYLSAGSLWLCLSVDEVCEKADYTHFAFSISNESFSDFVEKLTLNGVPQWKSNSSEGYSVYFLDPDGHKLEAHAGDLHSRLKSLKSLKNIPYKNQQWL